MSNIDNIQKEILNSIRFEYPYNKNPKKPPFALCCPECTESRLVWICNYDEDKRLTSVFMKDREKNAVYIDVAEALRIRNELLNAGWKEIKKPEATFKFSDKSRSNP